MSVAIKQVEIINLIRNQGCKFSLLPNGVFRTELVAEHKMVIYPENKAVVLFNKGNLMQEKIDLLIEKMKFGDQFYYREQSFLMETD